MLAFSPALAFAKRLARSGVDGIIVEGMEAGGHIGPVSTSILAQEILPELAETPIFVAGGIGRGEAIAAYLRMGAAGVQLGTRFVCAEESIAHPNFKRAFIKASARDAQPSVQLDPRFPVIPVRAIRNAATREFAESQREVIVRFYSGELDQKAAQLEIERYSGRRLAPGCHRRRCRTWFRHGGTERGHGDVRAADRRDHRVSGRSGNHALSDRV